MVHGYLDFARGEGTEAPVETDIALLLEDYRRECGARERRCASRRRPNMSCRFGRNALRRCLANLIANARRHGPYLAVRA